MAMMTIEKRRSITGVIFVSPWIIGLMLFFLQPLFMTLKYSFSYMSFSETGLVIKPLSIGLFQNYFEAFTKDPDFIRYLIAGVQKMLLTSPSVVIFSLFIAIVLHQQFKGRTFMRAMFFLPVIIATGIITTIIKQSLIDVARGTEGSSNIFSSIILMNILLESGIPTSIVQFLTFLINNVMDLVWQSGMQILIFLSGLLTIPLIYYEVSAVEGATKWEAFWKITFPLIRPYILVNLIYTIIDLFSSYDNAVMRYMVNMAYKNFRLSYASSLYWIYFVVVMIFIGVVYFFTNRKVYYDVN